MSRRSQAKRAARAKDRAKHRARAKDSASGAPPGFSFGDALASDDAFSDPGPFGRPGASRTRSQRGPAELLEGVRNGVPVGVALAEAGTVDRATFYRVAERLLPGWVRELYGAGWQPTELTRLARMQGNAATAELIRRALAAERDRRTGSTANKPSWQQQWAAAELPTGQDQTGWVAAWAQSVPEFDRLRYLFRLAAIMGGATQLELLLPPPPGVRVAEAPAGRPIATAADPVLERVRALLAKAESTEHEAEALAFTAKAQELMTKHAIDAAVVEGTRSAEGTPHIIRIPIDPPYADIKALLIQTVAEQTRCRTVNHSTLAMSSVVGYATDLEAVELLFTSLLVQAQRGLAEAGAAAPPGSRPRSQGFRSAFLHGFTERIGVRLAEVNRLAYTDAKGEAFLPVLRSRDARIDDFIDRRFGEMRSQSVRGGYDPLGYARGGLAGDAATLTSGAVESEAV